MKIGAENKKAVYVLALLGLGAAYGVYSNFSGPSYPTTTPRPAVRPGSPNDSPGPDDSQVKQKVGKSHAKSGEFHPVYLAKKKEQRRAAENIDPTIRFDLLDRVMKVPPAGGERDLFQISKSAPVTTAAVLPRQPEPKVIPFVGPRLPPPPAPPPRKVEPVEPPPTPPPFKYYGYSAVHPNGKRTAYFIEGDEIVMADEGQLVKTRWRIVQIGLDKVVVEDTQSKRRTPLNIEPEATQ